MGKTHEKLWESCLEIIKDNIPKEQYDAWFKDIVSLSYVDGKLTLEVPSPFFVEQLEERYIKILGRTLSKVYGENVKLFYQYNQIGDEPATKVSISSSNPSPAILPAGQVSPANPFQEEEIEEIDSQLNPRYTFENYCGSMSNKLACSIGEAIANDPSCKTFNPLFIFGPTGVGKTHLIQAIGIRIKETDPGRRVLYVTARLFESQYTTAVLQHKINDFINFYQSIDVLIIDDIQDLIGKEGTQRTFFHIFNHLHQNQKQLILSSDCCPSEMEGMEERLLSRFKWGVTAALERPDLELRRCFLKQKSEQEGLSIPQDVLEYIATNVTSSVRELEGIMVSLLAHATVLDKEISVELARNVLANAVKISRRQINFDMIAQEVSSYYHIDQQMLYSNTRKREISDARQMVMYLAKKDAKMSLTAIGNRLSRTHATVLYACKNIEERLTVERKLQEDASKIENALNS